MVLVAVRDDDAAQLVGVLQHVGVVGQDEIDARINEFMEKRTLEHLVNEYKSYQESQDMMYYI